MPPHQNLAVYETRQTALLRDLFLWAYERSCAQYRVIRDRPDSTGPTAPSLPRGTHLIDLNEGSAGRYRISPAELLAWQHAHRAD